MSHYDEVRDLQREALDRANAAHSPICPCGDCAQVRVAREAAVRAVVEARYASDREAERAMGFMMPPPKPGSVRAAIDALAAEFGVQA